MERVILICVLILFASGLYQGVSARRPTMITPSGKEHRIRIGEELKIECEGEGTLQISTQKFAENSQSKSILYVDDGSNHAIFIRKHTIAEDAGWYGCAEEGTYVENDDQTIDHPDENIAWTYVYVENPNDAPAFKPYQDPWIIVMVGQSAVIPCLTTSPHLSASLTFNENMVFSDWTYDKKIGFYKKNVTSNDVGIYECGINGDKNDQHPWFDLSVLAPSTELSKPKIDTNSLGFLVWGMNLTLTCSVDVTTTGSVLSLNWEAPSSVPQERLLVSEPTVTDPKNPPQVLIKNLTVINAAKTDSGEYICTAIGQGLNATEKDHCDIVLRDPNTPYINVTSDKRELSVELNEEGKRVQWRVTVVAFPDKLKWEWFDPSGNKILDSEMDKIGPYEHTAVDPNHFFSISKVDASHNGDYELKLSMGSRTESVLLKLAVKGRPQARIEKVTPTYGPGQRTKFKCIAKGSPLPNLEWSFVEYPDFPSTKKFDSRPFVIIDNNRKTIHWEMTSQVEVVVRGDGLLTCIACSNKNCSNATLPTSTTDPNENFKITGPHLAVQDDNVTLECRVSHDEYKENITWLLPSAESDSLPGDGRLNIDTIVDKNNTKTSVSRLTLREVKISARGTYSCIARSKVNGKQTKNHVLKVVEASVPRIVETVHMNDSKILVKSNQSLTLTCRARGAPNPEITWYKDDEQIEKGGQYSFMEENASLVIQFFYHTDSGKYFCLAKNRLGEDRRSMEIAVEGNQQSGNVTSISVICTLIVIIIIVITFMGFKVRREKQRRKDLTDAGLTHFKEGAIESLNPDLTVDDQAELLPYDQRWEFPRENLKLGKQLGSGAFGVVMKAEARGICVPDEVTTVAVKMVRRTAEPSYMKALASELKIMIHLGRHINVVNILGACTKTILTKRELLVIVEYCHFGNLHHYLQHHRNNFVDQIDPLTKKINPDIGMEMLNPRSSLISQDRSIYGTSLLQPASPSIKSTYSNNSVETGNYRTGSDYRGDADVSMSPDGGILSNNSVQPGWRSNYRGDYKDQNLKPICTQDLLCWAWQVSRGMEYLSSRNVLHGDLAARNILLADDNIVKICDFGLAKNMYKDNNYKKKGDSPLPIKWMAIESIRDRMFSTHSDVWSFGIVLWEFFTLARTPYPGMEAEKQYERLIKGYRMEKPEYATDEIYNFMLDCWHAEPTMRPSFSDLVEKLGTLLDEPVKTRYFDLNAPYVNTNAEVLRNGQSDYLTMMSSPNHVYSNTSNPAVDPSSGYVPMNRFIKSTEAGPSSQTQEFRETHFDCLPDNHQPDVDLDVENDPESVPMLADEVGANFMKHSNDRNSKLPDDGYYNLVKNPHYANLNNGKNPDVPSAGKKSQNVYRGDHVIDVLQVDEKSSRIKNPIFDSITNPSYVTMFNNRVK